MSYVNFRLSDIKDHTRHIATDEYPLYQDIKSPDDSLNMGTSAINVQVPIFSEKLNAR